VMVVTALVTIAMTWLVMPRLVRLFAAWLYPKAPTTR
jgi:antibiotic biosynthesis monooxygenase (ABM) superfamily enzyme